MCLQSACMRGCKVTLLHLFDFSPLCVFKCVLMKAIWGDIWKITIEKVKQMQPMWLAFSHEGDLRRHLKHCQRHNGPRNWVRNLRYLIRKYIFILISNIYLFWYLIYHSGEKWNKCNQCDNASFRAGDLRIHLITHSGEKLNECNQCDNAFSHAGYLRTHLIMDNGEKSSKCNQCDYDTVSGWGQDLFHRNSYFESGQMGLK